MRKSLQDVAYMVKDIPYPGQLPPEISHLHCYLSDSGHAIMCVPASLLDEALQNELWMYEAPVPVRYVLARGWRPIPGSDSIQVDVPYDDMLGVVVPDEFYED